MDKVQTINFASSKSAGSHSASAKQDMMQVPCHLDISWSRGQCRCLLGTEARADKLAVMHMPGLLQATCSEHVLPKMSSSAVCLHEGDLPEFLSQPDMPAVMLAQPCECTLQIPRAADCTSTHAEFSIDDIGYESKHIQHPSAAPLAPDPRLIQK